MCPSMLSSRSAVSWQCASSANWDCKCCDVLEMKLYSRRWCTFCHNSSRCLVSTYRPPYWLRHRRDCTVSRILQIVAAHLYVSSNLPSSRSCMWDLLNAYFPWVVYAGGQGTRDYSRHEGADKTVYIFGSCSCKHLFLSKYVIIHRLTSSWRTSGIEILESISRSCFSEITRNMTDVRRGKSGRHWDLGIFLPFVAAFLLGIPPSTV